MSIQDSINNSIKTIAIMSGIAEILKVKRESAKSSVNERKKIQKDMIDDVKAQEESLKTGKVED